MRYRLLGAFLEGLAPFHRAPEDVRYLRQLAVEVRTLEGPATPAQEAVPRPPAPSSR